MYLGIGGKKRWRVLIPLCCILLAAGCNASEQPKSVPAEVVYSVVGEEKLTLTSTLPGRVSALVTAEVRPQVDGIILERLFEEGADVRQGQVLYQINPAVYQAAYNTAEATLTEAEAPAVALALLEKRYRNLVRTKAVRQQDLDNAISDHGQARARIARAKAELEAAAINLAYTRITAPVSGRIGASSVTPGTLVVASQPAALAIIQQTDRVYVDITQSSADIIRLRRAMAQGRMSPNGGAVKVRLALEDGAPYIPIADDHENETPSWIWGNLLFSEISVGRTTGSVALRAVFDNPDGLLLPGMYVTATIEEGALEVVAIPQRSVLTGGSGDHFVYVLHSREAGPELFQVERRAVTLSRSLGNRWVVKSGLFPGDLLVIEGLQKAIPGAVVKGVPVHAQKAPATQREAR